LLWLLCHYPDLSDGTTAAALYQALIEDEATLLVDEGDNLGILENKEIRQFMHSGFEYGHTLDRGGPDGRKRKYPTYAPLPIAASGLKSLSIPLIDRSIINKMMRRPRNSPRLPRLSIRNPSFAYTRRQIEYWKADAKLEFDPKLPDELDDRAQDCWRVL